jgi:thymidine phosphorylase
MTDMNEVLGTTAGNALEVGEAIAFLTGEAREPRMLEVTTELAVALLVRGGLEAGDEEARGAVTRALDSGAAAARFAAMVAALGGPADLVEAPGSYLKVAPVQRDAVPERAGFVSAVDCRAVGLAITGLGGNRAREDDDIDPAVGLSDIAPVGAEVGPDRPLAVVHARSDAAADGAVAALRAAVTIADAPPAPRPTVAART